VAVVFTREMTPPLTGLVKKLDKATAEHADAHMASFVVVLSDDQDATEKQLKDFIKKDDIQKTVLTIFDRAGPAPYHIAKDADVTVLLYRNKTVKANYAFKRGEFTDKTSEEILGDLPKILDK
jgi:hypothetical protein